jgi:hypothetical protein
MGPNRRFLFALFTFILPALAAAGARDDILARYAAEARQSNLGFAGFSAERGQAFHERSFAGGKAETAACTACHGPDPRRPGRTPAGKAIDPVAVSAAPARYTDPAKVEKWFKRNCSEVLGRPCTALEKGDWLTYMSRQ